MIKKILPISITIALLSITPSLNASTNAADAIACNNNKECFNEILVSYNKKDPKTLDMLTKFISIPEYSEKAGFIYSRILYETGNISGIDQLEKNLKNINKLKDYNLFYLHKLQVKNNQHNKAIKTLETLLEDKSTVLKNEVYYILANLYFDKENNSKAKKYFKKFINSKNKGEDNKISESIYKLSVISKTENKKEEQLKYLKKIWTRHPLSSESIDAERTLSQQPSFPSNNDLIDRANTYMKSRKYDFAIDEFKKVFKKNKSYVSSSYLKFGISYYNTKQYKKAGRIFKNLVTNVQTSFQTVESAYFYLSKVYFLQEKDKKLIATLTVYKKRFPKGKHLPKSLRMAGLLYYDQGKLSNVEWFFKKQSGFHINNIAAMGTWELGWFYYKEGRYADAVGAFNQYNKKFTKNSDYRKVLYWTGKAYEKTGDVVKALKTYKKVCSLFKHSFYCHSSLARTIVIQDQRSDLAEHTAKVMDLINPMDGLQESNRQTYKVNPTDKKLLADRTYYKFTLLSDMGFTKEARKEAEVLFNKYKFLRSQLSNILNKAEDYYRLKKLIASYYGGTLTKGDIRKPKRFWQDAYNLGFMNIIEPSVLDKDIDKYFVSAIIREESAYNVEAVSGVGAIGLMQLMTDTGEWIAKRTGEEFRKEMLFNKETNIKMGSYYLNYLFNEMDKNIVFTIASYNAGPDKVNEWSKRFSKLDTDEFIESIPYRETRMFAKRVLRSYMEYARLTNNNKELIKLLNKIFNG